MGPNYKMRKYSLLVFGSCGLVSILIDLDHLIIEDFNMVRPLHIPIFVCMWLISLCYLSYIYGRVHTNSVGDNNENRR